MAAPTNVAHPNHTHAGIAEIKHENKEKSQALTRAVSQIEKTFGKDVTTRTWDTIQKVARK